ncbi:MAG: hypothetical protein N4A41_03340 [Crocinitomicaceae bacterium]|jgi:hypothetical protein|nr:hypothetical protein [Crocinitomicaceae bacterium]
MRKLILVFTLLSVHAIYGQTNLSQDRVNHFGFRLHQNYLSLLSYDEYHIALRGPFFAERYDIYFRTNNIARLSTTDLEVSYGFNTIRNERFEFSLNFSLIPERHHVFYSINPPEGSSIFKGGEKSEYEISRFGLGMNYGWDLKNKWIFKAGLNCQFLFGEFHFEEYRLFTQNPDGTGPSFYTVSGKDLSWYQNNFRLHTSVQRKISTSERAELFLGLSSSIVPKIRSGYFSIHPQTSLFLSYEI